MAVPLYRKSLDTDCAHQGVIGIIQLASKLLTALSFAECAMLIKIKLPSTRPLYVSVADA